MGTWIRPARVQASHRTTYASEFFPYAATRSPFWRSRSRSAFAARFTATSSSAKVQERFSKTRAVLAGSRRAERRRPSPTVLRMLRVISGRTTASPLALGGGLVILELLAQLHLQELAGGGFGDLLDELVGVREPELGEILFEVFSEVVLGDVLAIFEDYRRERALVPLFVGHGDDGGFGDGRVCHKGVFKFHGGNPLAARFYEVFGAVRDLDETPPIYGDDVAGLEPAAFGELVVALLGVEVGLDDGGPAHLELAHRLPVPRDEPLVAARPYLDERHRQALGGLVVELLFLRERPDLGAQVGDGAYGGHLRHPPRVHDVYAVALPVRLDHALWRRRAADDHGVQRG